MKILVTGSAGLIGGEAVEYFDKQGHMVFGVDNNMRKEFFGDAGDTSWNLHRIFHICKRFTPENVDIRDRISLKAHVFDKHGPFDVVIHCAAQPSHDKAKEIPILDFEVNALGTINLLELTRQTNPNAIFIFTSTNKVYGDIPNYLPLVELATRHDYERDTPAVNLTKGINETMSIDASVHSVFGASKVAADVMVQEYGKCYGLRTIVFRGGCLTGPHHSGVKLHGFLSYLAKCGVNDIPYTIYGYKGKQVRDNIHSYDVIKAFECVINDPPEPGSVYNLGGGRENSISMMEAISYIEKFLNKKIQSTYEDTPRAGDHICYISDMSRFKARYPNWRITKSIDNILTEILGKALAGAPTERYIPGDGEDDRFNAYANWIVPQCKGRVIDIGCGHGYLTQKIARMIAVKEVTGTDKDTHNTQHNPKIFYWLINTEDLSKTTNMGLFDTIVSTEHIEHLGWRLHEPLIKWIAAHLSPTGQFIGSMPIPDDPNNPNPFHFKTYTKDDWTDLLKLYFDDVYSVMLYKDCYGWIASKPKVLDENTPV